MQLVSCTLRGPLTKCNHSVALIQDPLHDYVLELTGKDDPVVLYAGTATGDDAGLAT